MPETQSQPKQSEAAFYWQCPEYVKYHKGFWWYLVSITVLLLLIAWSLQDGQWFGNQSYLFIVFLVLFYLVVLIYEFRAPENVAVAITPDGVKFGHSFFFYRDIEDFFVVYQDQG
ncbi:MAG: hypothetical protein Q8L21_03080, partial [Candidatus Komeilibacteria bacterium]|nr:hypothetical protein [Candidatus Komeilibacteria bacterium]